MNALMGNNKQSSGHGGGSSNPLGQLAGQFLGGGKQSHGGSGGGGSGGLAGQLVGSLLGGGKQSHGGSSGQQQQHGGSSGQASSGGLGGLLGSVMGGGSVSTCNMDKSEIDRLTKNSITSPPATTDTATARPPSLAALIPAPHRPRRTNPEVSLASTDSRATTATHRLHPDSTAVVHRHTRVKEVTANHRNSIPANSTQVATDHRLASVDKVGTTMAEHHPADTDSKQVMAVQPKGTMVVQQTTTTTSTTR
jgi:hypothetical protein